MSGVTKGESRARLKLEMGRSLLLLLSGSFEQADCGTPGFNKFHVSVRKLKELLNRSLNPLLFNFCFAGAAWHFHTVSSLLADFNGFSRHLAERGGYGGFAAPLRHASFCVSKETFTWQLEKPGI